MISKADIDFIYPETIKDKGDPGWTETLTRKCNFIRTFIELVCLPSYTIRLENREKQRTQLKKKD